MENACAESLFEACDFIKKETLVQVFSWEFCKTFKNTLFKGHVQLLLPKHFLKSLLIDIIEFKFISHKLYWTLSLSLSNRLLYEWVWFFKFVVELLKKNWCSFKIILYDFFALVNHNEIAIYCRCVCILYSFTCCFIT